MLLSNAMLLAMMVSGIGVGLVAASICGALIEDWLEARSDAAHEAAQHGA